MCFPVYREVCSVEEISRVKEPRTSFHHKFENPVAKFSILLKSYGKNILDCFYVFSGEVYCLNSLKKRAIYLFHLTVFKIIELYCVMAY